VELLELKFSVFFEKKILQKIFQFWGFGGNQTERFGWCGDCIANYCTEFDIRHRYLDLLVPFIHLERIKKTALCGGF